MFNLFRKKITPYDVAGLILKHAAEEQGCRDKWAWFAQTYPAYINFTGTLQRETQWVLVACGMNALSVLRLPHPLLQKVGQELRNVYNDVYWNTEYQSLFTADFFTELDRKVKAYSRYHHQFVNYAKDDTELFAGSVIASGRMVGDIYKNLIGTYPPDANEMDALQEFLLNIVTNSQMEQYALLKKYRILDA